MGRKKKISNSQKINDLVWLIIFKIHAAYWKLLNSVKILKTLIKSYLRHFFFRDRQKNNLERLLIDRFWLLYTVEDGDFIEPKGEYLERSFRITRGQLADFVDVIYNKTSAIKSLEAFYDSQDCFRIKILAIWF